MPTVTTTSTAPITRLSGAHTASHRPAPLRARPTGYEALQVEYARYFGPHNGITETDQASLRDYFFRYPNVEMECYQTVTAKAGDPATCALTTDGVTACLAICGRGRNAEGEPVLYLAHSSVEVGKAILAHAIKSLLNLGCPLATIDLYVLGGEAAELDSNGRPVPPDVADADDEGDEGEREDPLCYRETFEAAAAYPAVRGMKLPLASCSDDPDPDADKRGTAVVLTADSLLFCKAEGLPQDGLQRGEDQEIEDLGNIQSELFSILHAPASGSSTTAR